MIVIRGRKRLVDRGRLADFDTDIHRDFWIDHDLCYDSDGWVEVKRVGEDIPSNEYVALRVKREGIPKEWTIADD